MTCDENRPCQRCIKRDIGHLCRNEATPQNGNGARNRAGRKQAETSSPNTMISPYALVNMGQMPPAHRDILPTLELERPPVAGPSIMTLDHELNPPSHASASLPQDALPAPPLESSNSFDGGLSSFDMNLGGSSAGVSHIPSQKPKRNGPDSSMPLLHQLKTFTSSAPSSTAGVHADAFTDPVPSHSVYGSGTSLAARITPTKPDAGKAADMHGSQLGGTAWLGLGGSSQHTGDAGGGGELDILHDFLSSIDDGSGAMAPSNELVHLPLKPDVPPTMQTTLLSRDGSSALDPPNSSTLPSSTTFSPQDKMELIAGSPPRSTSSVPLPSLAQGYPFQRQQLQRRNSFEAADQKRNDIHPSDATLHSSDSMSSSTPNLSAAMGGENRSDIDSTSYHFHSPSKAASKTEQFLLTAADQKDGSRDERLQQVIRAKWEAGLLRPFNHVKGYARLNQWMENNVSPSSRRRILKPLSVFKPVFITLSKSLTNFDLICVEEAFERLLLDYDRVFSIQGIPACLWRRTGEIYKGNKEFAELVGMPIESLRDGRLCIYELMTEESAVNYWEKYGSVCFDSSQKAVLTMCTLLTRNKSLRQANHQTSSPSDENEPSPHTTDTDSSYTQASSGRTISRPPAHILCCFSFTIRRDRWNVRVLLAMKLATFDILTRFAHWFSLP